MGIPTRHDGAPYKGGERASGTDLEDDISSIYEEFNGNIDDDNISAIANLNGDKFLIGSIDNTRLADLTIEGRNFEADAVESAKLADDAVTTRKMSVGAVLNTDVARVAAGVPQLLTFGSWTPHFTTTITTSAGTLGVLLIFSFELYYPPGTAFNNHTLMRLMQDDGAPALIHQFSPVCRWTLSVGPAPNIETTTLISGAFITTPLLGDTSYLFTLELQKLVNASLIETRQGSLTAIEMRR